MIALEALSYGCNCISTDSPCLPEIFKDSAVYYKAGDHKTLAGSIKTILERSCGQHARESKNALDFITFSKTVGNAVMTGLNGSFETGKISMGKQMCKQLELEGWNILKDYAAQITERIDNQDISVTELVDELSNEEKRLLAGLLDEHQIKHLAKLKEL